MNAWICACQTTDRDLESVSAMKKVNAWICAHRTTDHDPANAIFMQSVTTVTSVTSVIFLQPYCLRINVEL